LGDWASWLEKLRETGVALVGNPKSDPANLGAPQTIAGLQFQHDAIELLKRLSEITHATPDAALIERQVKLENALALVKAFESERSPRIERQRVLTLAPLTFCAENAAIMFLAYLFAIVLSRFGDTRRTWWTQQHSRAGKSVLTGVSILFLLMLLFLSGLRQAGAASLVGMDIARTLWYAVLAVSLCFGLVYPLFAMKTLPRSYANAKHKRRIAYTFYTSLMRRYYGVLLGGFLVACALWFLAFRLVVHFYPSNVELLVSGLDNEELDVVRRVQELLL
jgi:hypothetical protein